MRRLLRCSPKVAGCSSYGFGRALVEQSLTLATGQRVHADATTRERDPGLAKFGREGSNPARSNLPSRPAPLPEYAFRGEPRDAR